MECQKSSHGSQLSQYTFIPVCCYQNDCQHSLCQDGKPVTPRTWYPGGLPLTHLPLPVKNPSRLWGSQSRLNCRYYCTGHYTSVMTNIMDPSAVKHTAKPPPKILKDLFCQLLGKETTYEFIENTAKAAMLARK